MGLASFKDFTSTERTRSHSSDGVTVAALAAEGTDQARSARIRRIEPSAFAERGSAIMKPANQAARGRSLLDRLTARARPSAAR